MHKSSSLVFILMKFYVFVKKYEESRSKVMNITKMSTKRQVIKMGPRRKGTKWKKIQNFGRVLASEAMAFAPSTTPECNWHLQNKQCSSLLTEQATCVCHPYKLLRTSAVCNTTNIFLRFWPILDLWISYRWLDLVFF